MARRRGTKKREVLPDPIYKDTLVTKFINSLMYSGKKSVAEGIFYKTLDLIKERGSEEGIEVFKKAIENVRLWSRKYRRNKEGIAKIDCWK